MANSMITIRTADDLAKLNGSHIESITYERDSNSLTLVVSHVTWPNKVIVSINLGLINIWQPQGSMVYQPAFMFSTADMVKPNDANK